MGEGVQGSHRVAQAHGAHVGVGWRPVLIGAAAEGLGPGHELHVHLDANHRLVLHLLVGSWRLVVGCW